MLGGLRFGLQCGEGRLLIKLEQQLKEAKDERDAATKAAGVIQAKLDAANEEIEKNGVILEEKDVFIKTLIQTPKGK